MRLTLTRRDSGPQRYLELDHEREVVRLLGAQEEPLGSVTWETLIRLICASAADMAGREKRSSARAPVALRVAYRTRDHDEGVSVTRDIGAGGLFIETAKPLPAGTELSLDFVLPDPPFEHVHAKARVAWLREMAERNLFLPGMGVQFVNPVPRLHSRGIGALPFGAKTHSSPPSPRTTTVVRGSQAGLPVVRGEHRSAVASGHSSARPHAQRVARQHGVLQAPRIIPAVPNDGPLTPGSLAA